MADASVWNPGSGTVNIDAESTNVSEVFTSAAAQTLYILTAFTYTVGTSSLAIYRNGQRLVRGVDWEETSSTSFTLLVIVAAGETVEAVSVIGSTSESAASAAASAAEAEAAAAAAAVFDPTYYLTKVDNLASVANAAVARSNLGAASIAQGAKADSALQPAAVGVSVQGYDADTAFIDQSQTWTGAPKTSVLTDNDLSFDISAKKDFLCTPAAGGTLTFTGLAAGQKGEIILVNPSAYTISKAASVKCASTMLATISAAGTYLLAYRCFNGTDVYVTNSGALA